MLLFLHGLIDIFYINTIKCVLELGHGSPGLQVQVVQKLVYTKRLNIPLVPVWSPVSEGPDAGGEDHERPGLEQGQRGGF